MSKRLTAEELRIEPIELEALLWVRDALDPSIPDKELPKWMRFDMDSWAGLDRGRLSRCGTACCIGGSMEMYISGVYKKRLGEILTGEEYDAALSGFERAVGPRKQDGSKAFYALFYRWKDSGNTREGAVAAIDQFMAGNIKNPWLREDMG